MTIIPALLDSRPAFLGSEVRASSLLQLPTGNGPLVTELARRVRSITAHPPIVVPTFAAASDYEDGLRAACPAVESVCTPSSLREVLAGFDPSDSLLLIASHIQPADGLDLKLILSETAEGQMVRHLLAFEATSVGTKEFVHRDDGGRVRRIQRYFDPVTWPFPAGVIASLVPLASLHGDFALPLDSLPALRLAISTRGLPSRDIRYYGPWFDLGEEEGALALAERNVMARNASVDPRASQVPPSAIVHRTARVFGAVAFGKGVTLEEQALVIGPAVLGDGCTVRANAIVAQCLVLSGAEIADGVTLRQRVVIDRPARNPARAEGPQRRNGHWATAPAPDAAPGRPRISYQQLKRFCDGSVALVSLLLLSPLFALIGVLIKLSSPGPIFFGHLREGKGGKPFRCWKFRTMRPDADAMQRALVSKQKMDGPQFKMDNDPRVTSVGNWLRKLNIDELPQLVNVLLGEMSLVGPRPSPFRENQICVPWRNGRLSVRPGITGLWQICRRDRDQGDFHQWIHYDLLYVRNVSAWVDVKILVSTISSRGGKIPVSLSSIIPSHHESAAQPVWSEPLAWTEAPVWTPRADEMVAVETMAIADLVPVDGNDSRESEINPWDPGRAFGLPQSLLAGEGEMVTLTA